METERSKTDGSTGYGNDPHSAGNGAAANGSKRPLYLQIPPDLQQEIRTALDRASRNDQEFEIKQPLRIEIAKDEDPTVFEKRTVRLGYVGLTVAFLSLLAASVAAYFVGQQFLAMNEQTALLDVGQREARRDSAKAAITTKYQIQAAQDQAKAAQDSLKVLKNQFVLDQRPNVISNGFTIGILRPDNLTADGPPSEGRPVVVKIGILNIGKSNALDIRIFRHLVFGEDSFRNSRADSGIDWSDRKGALSPGKPIYTLASSLIDPYSSVSEEAIPAPKDLLQWDGREPIFVFGAFTYFDEVGSYYCTPFRERWAPPGNGWLNAEDFTDKITGKKHTSDELCPEYHGKNGRR